jgi:MULE transposase domain
MLQFHINWDLTVFLVKTICFIQHGTNRYRLKLGLFTKVDSNGATRILAACLVTCETAESFSWAFDCFMDAFRIPPRILFTDGDPAMAAAIKMSFPSTLRFLCTWHLSKILQKNVRPIFSGNKTAGHKFNYSWWRICLTTDSSCTVTFHEDWESLLSVLPRNENLQSQGLQRVLAWLDRLKEQRTRWAARYTWKKWSFIVLKEQRQFIPRLQDFCRHPCCFRIFWKRLTTIRAISAPAGRRRFSGRLV